MSAKEKATDYILKKEVKKGKVWYGINTIDAYRVADIAIEETKKELHNQIRDLQKHETKRIIRVRKEERELKSKATINAMVLINERNQLIKQARKEEREKCINAFFRELYCDEDVHPTHETSWVNDRLEEIKEELNGTQ